MNTLLHECRRHCARLLAAVELHRLTFRTAADQTLCCKRRTVLSGWLIPPGNLFLKLIGADSEVLSERDWLRWETAIVHAMAPEPHAGVVPESTVQQRELRSPLCSGTPLQALLRDHQVAVPAKLTAIRLALQALLRLQSHRVVLDETESLLVSTCDSRWQLSHGDATAENVCVSLPDGTARWYDFDTRHRLTIPAPVRHADDFRALLFSSAVLLPTDEYERLAQLFIESLPSPEVQRCFLTRLHQDWKRPNLFHLGQAPLSFSAYDQLRTRLTAALAGSVRATYP